MQFRRAMLAAAVAVMTLASSVSALDSIGAFSPLEVGEEHTQLLTKALADDALYAPSVTARACYVEIESLGTQVVSGSKYKFTVKACSTATGKAGGGKCAGENANCKAEPMVIMVFDQPWTETLQVLAIEKSGGDAQGSKKDDAKEDETAKSNSGADDGSMDSKDKEAPMLTVTKTDGSSGSAGNAKETVTATPETPASATRGPSPSSAVPTPSPTTSAASATATAVTVALGAVVTALHVL